MTLTEIMNIRYDFSDKIQEISDKLEKAKRFVKIEREYANETNLPLSLEIIKGRVKQQIHLKQLRKELKKVKALTLERVKRVEHERQAIDSFADAFKVLLAYINCFNGLYTGICTMETYFDTITQSELFGNKENVDYVEEMLSIAENHYLDLLSIKKNVDAYMVKDDEKVNEHFIPQSQENIK